jgi:hypothetical protein
MYAWAKPDYLLDEMSLDQWRQYYRLGWEAKQTEMQMNWGILGMLLKGEDPQSKEKIRGLERFKKSHPDGEVRDGAYIVSR